MADLEQLAKEITKSTTNSCKSNNNLNDIKDQIRENKNTTNTFKDTASFEKHVENMRKLVEEEHEQKRKFRKIATYGAFGLVIYSIIFITSLFGFLVVLRGYIPPASVLVGVSVSFVANIIGLATIVFKYVFSSTKETTDYISKIDSHD
ncbi:MULTISPECIES: hypothetical protein [Streptococcus anginosus group]|uniref:hypothetical protein n=1 Tax=Streptococcus anginosus group TaxID=671232 RepID=UPI0020014C9D|nr:MULTISPECIES: hypothetical protein [Streptococcus anginosus group]